MPLFRKTDWRLPVYSKAAFVVFAFLPCATTTLQSGSLGWSVSRSHEDSVAAEVEGTKSTSTTQGHAPAAEAFADARFVNDNQGEVDSADTLDGSLTGGDISTSGGDVTFGGGARISAAQGVFGVSVSASGFNSTVSGGNYGVAAGDYSTISGGRYSRAYGYAASVGGGYRCSASGLFSTVSGGYYGSAPGLSSTVAGGGNNLASGDASVVGGGVFNRSRGTRSTVSGGSANTVDGVHGTIAGGSENDAFGNHGTVAGGRQNLASGDYGFAAGRRARALHDGSFVWGDSVDTPKNSSASDQFNVYAEGGMRVFADGQSTPSRVRSNALADCGGSNTTGGQTSSRTDALAAGARSGSSPRSCWSKCPRPSRRAPTATTAWTTAS